MDTQSLIDTVCPKIRDLGWTYYFVGETVAVGEAVGLDALTFYVLGRGGVLGDVEPEVVASAFGYFNPEMVAAIWTAGRAILPPREAGRLHWACAADLGRQAFSDLPDLEGFCAAAGAVNDAADSVGLPLFAGFHAEGLVEDLPGRAMQLMAILREFRGSAHLVGVKASGLVAKTAHAFTRPNDMAMFGWTPDDLPEIDQEVNEAMARAEAITDDLVAPAYGVLDEDGQRSLIEGVDRIEAILVR
jgi:hypothetical protein